MATKTRACAALVAAALLIAASPAAAASTRYASPSGSGTSCSPADPCSLETAVNDAQMNDEVVVAPGNYAISQSLAPSASGVHVHGVADQPAPAISYSGGAAAIQIGLTTSDSRFSHLQVAAPNGTGIFAEACNATWEQLLVSGAKAIECDGAISGLTLRDTVAHSTAAGDPALQLGASPGGGKLNATLRNVTAIASGGSTPAIDIRALNLAPPCSSSTFADLTASVDAKNVIARGTGARDIRVHGDCTDGSASLTIAYSNYATIDKTGSLTAPPADGTVTDGGHNQTDAPVFVNAAAGNFHEQPSSPTVDAGTEDTQNGTTDVDGGPRELGLAPDIGADEYVASPFALSVPRSHASAVLLQDGRVLIAGGISSAARPRNADVYDPATGRVAPAGYMSSGRFLSAASVLESGKVLVSGGSDSSVHHDAELYDPLTNQWSTAGNLPGSVPRWRHTSTLLGNGKVLVVGGADGSNNPLKTSARYSPTSAWSSGPQLTTARYDHTATLLADGRVLVVGGYGATALASAEVSNAAVDAWSSAGNMATGRAGHTATLLQNGKVLVAGGVDSTGEETAKAELYDPATNTWSSAGTMATARSAHSATLLRDGRVLVQGGFTPGKGAQRSSEVYDPGTNSWNPGPDLAAARAGHTATLLLDGRVFVAGGEGLSSFELAPARAPNRAARRPVVAYVDPQGHFGLYDSETRTDLAPPPLPTGLARFATSLDGRYVVYADAATPHHIHLFDRRARAQLALPGVDVFPNPDGLSVSNAGLISLDNNSNGPMRLYDSKSKTFVATGLVGTDSMSESDSNHRQPRLSGDGRFLATTCQTNCVAAPVSGSDLYLQDLATKTNFPMPNDPNRNSEHPCIDAAGSLVGADLTPATQKDIALYARASGGLLPVPNSPTLNDVRCALNASGEAVTLQEEVNGTNRLYDRLVGALVPLPAKVHGRLSLSDLLDLTPPQTTIVGGPPPVTGARTARFSFVSSERGSSFRCKLDGAAFVPCSSPRLYAKLKDGQHTFRVRAIDAAGNADPTPAVRTWKVGTAVTALAVAPSAFKRSHGTTVTYVLTRAATVSFSVCHKTNGKCVAVKGGFKRTGRAGKNSFHFDGRVDGKALAPGRYALVAKPGGVRSPFRITQP